MTEETNMNINDLSKIANEATPGQLLSEKSGRGSWLRGSITGEWAAMSCGDSNESADANAEFIVVAWNLTRILLQSEEGRRIITTMLDKS